MAPVQIGVCTWALAIPNLRETLDVVKNDLSLRCIQLGFMGGGSDVPVETVELVRATGLTVTATAVGFEGEDYSSIARISETGGYVVDADWDLRREKTMAVGRVTSQLGVKYLSVHVGFVPHDTADERYTVMCDRVRSICKGLGELGVTLVMETGQETAENLLAFIDAVGEPNIGINFDPANMILYGVGEPVEALELLKDHVVHVHMKDGTWSDAPGEKWGEDVVLGTGQADIPRVVSKLKAQGYAGPLMIEREAGDQRVADIREAVTLLESLGGQR